MSEDISVKNFKISEYLFLIDKIDDVKMIDSAEYFKRGYGMLDKIREGETLIIDGNHDTKNMEKSFSPGYFIGDRKSNHRYLGQIAADVRLASNLTARLIHLKGRAYAKSYTLQKYIRGLAPVGMPNMIFKGHSHDSIYMNVQGIECLHTSTLQHGISNFAKELGFQDEIGAWIITYEIENSKLKRFVPELIRF